MSGAGKFISSIFGGGQSQAVQAITAPPSPPAPPSVNDASVQDAERRQRVAAAKMQGRSATIQTGGEGVTPEEDKANKATKYLLG